MELGWCLLGVLIGMAAMWASCYFTETKPARKERDEYKRQRDTWRKLAYDWQDNCNQALKQHQRAIILIDKLQASKPLDDQAEWRIDDYAKRMKGEGYG